LTASKTYRPRGDSVSSAVPAGAALGSELNRFDRSRPNAEAPALVGGGPLVAKRDLRVEARDPISSARHQPRARSIRPSPRADRYSMARNGGVSSADSGMGSSSSLEAILPTVQFSFGVGSRYSYLAATQAQQLARETWPDSCGAPFIAESSSCERAPIHSVRARAGNIGRHIGRKTQSVGRTIAASTIASLQGRTSTGNCSRLLAWPRTRLGQARRTRPDYSPNASRKADPGG
jgi:hypothetical protein